MKVANKTHFRFILQ